MNWPHHCVKYRQCSCSSNRARSDDLRHKDRMKTIPSCRRTNCEEDECQISRPWGNLFEVCSLYSFGCWLVEELSLVCTWSWEMMIATLHMRAFLQASFGLWSEWSSLSSSSKQWLLFYKQSNYIAYNLIIITMHCSHFQLMTWN